MQTSFLYRRVILFSLLAAAVFQTVSCARVATTPKSAMLPATPEPAFPPALPGEKTPGCDHVLAVLRALQDYANGLSAQRVAFEFTEAEIDEYLAYSLRVKPRPGLYQIPGVRRLRHFPTEKYQRPRRYRYPQDRHGVDHPGHCRPSARMVRYHPRNPPALPPPADLDRYSVHLRRYGPTAPARDPIRPSLLV